MQQSIHSFIPPICLNQPYLPRKNKGPGSQTGSDITPPPSPWGVGPPLLGEILDPPLPSPAITKISPIYPQMLTRCQVRGEGGDCFYSRFDLHTTQRPRHTLPKELRLLTGELWHCGDFSVWRTVTVSFYFIGIWPMTAVVVLVTVLFSKLTATRPVVLDCLVVSSSAGRASLLPVDGLPVQSLRQPSTQSSRP